MSGSGGIQPLGATFRFRNRQVESCASESREFTKQILLNLNKEIFYPS